MFEVIKKQKDSVLVKMDINTYNWFEEEMKEDFDNFETK